MSFDLLVCNKRKKENLHFLVFFACHVIVLLFEYFSVRVGTYLLPLLKSESDNCASAVYTSRTLSMEPPSNNHSNAKQHQCINTVAQKWW
jgi:hypothetical protein